MKGDRSSIWSAIMALFHTPYSEVPRKPVASPKSGPSITIMPTRLEIRFASQNPHKIAEAISILGPRNVAVIESSLKIEELQTTDTQRLVDDKVLKAFGKIGRPLFVEHTGLYLSHLNGLPGGLTQIFWDTLKADRFADLFGKLAPVRTATAKTFIGYCDGRRVHHFEGRIDGQITPQPRGSRDFQWDCVFQPDGFNETFAEMGERKNEISMRRLALEKMAQYLETDARHDRPTR